MYYVVYMYLLQVHSNILWRIVTARNPCDFVAVGDAVKISRRRLLSVSFLMIIQLCRGGHEPTTTACHDARVTKKKNNNNTIILQNTPYDILCVPCYTYMIINMVFYFSLLFFFFFCSPTSLLLICGEPDVCAYRPEAKRRVTNTK